MAVSLYTPWFQASGFGPLGLSLDPAHYDHPSDWLPADVPQLVVTGGDRYVLSASSSSGSSDSPGPVSDRPRAMASEVSYVLEFVAGKYAGSKRPLKSGESVEVGNASNAGIALIDPLVDKRHARISFTDAGLYLEDLGSRNGTYVDGRRIKEKTKLKAGNRILIGSSSLVVTASSAAVPEAAPVTFRLEASGPLTVPDVHARFGTRLAFFSFLQLFKNDNYDGRLEINGEEQKGKLELRRGQVVDASIEGIPQLSVLKAFSRIVVWEKGALELFPLGEQDEREFPQAIESLEAMLMEAVRQLDELRNIGLNLPPRTAGLTLVQPAKQGRVDLTSAEVEVLQLIPAHGNLQAVLDNAQVSDLDASLALLSLIKKGLVRVI